MTSREDAATIERLRAENTKLHAELRRVYEELDWRDEKIRVLTRVIERTHSLREQA